jgi:hypothetical protein
MALALARSRSNGGSTVKGDVPDLRKDARIAPELELLAAFRRRHARLERDRLRAVIQNEQQRKPPDPGSYFDRQFKGQLAALEAADLVDGVGGATSPAALEKDASDKAILDGQQVLRGVNIEPLPTFAAELAAIDRQRETLRLAIFAQTEVIERIEGELNVEYSHRLKHQFDRIELSAFEAAAALAAAQARMRRLHAEVVAAGIAIRHDIVMTRPCPAAVSLGDEHYPFSAIALWRTDLEARGLLP